MSKLVQLKQITDGGMGAEEPLAARCKAHSRWGICCKFFGKKIAILMPFGLHFACFQTHSKEQNF